jgi:hypothetical protein
MNNFASPVYGVRANLLGGIRNILQKEYGTRSTGK